MKTLVKNIRSLYTDDGQLELVLTVPISAKDEVQGIKDLLASNKRVECEIKRQYTKRSLDSNAYLWVLLDKIADKTKSSKLEVYKEFIKDYGVFEPIPIKDEAVDTFKHRWSSKGLGWICQEIGKSKLPGYTTLFAYYGTSVYDSKEMSRLLEQVVQQAKELGIETMSPQEIEEMNKRWENNGKEYNTR